MNKVKVISGVNEVESEVLAGRTVDAVRCMLSQTLNIDPNSKAHINKVEVTGAHVIRNGDTLEFIKASGAKGS